MQSQFAETGNQHKQRDIHWGQYYIVGGKEMSVRQNISSMSHNIEGLSLQLEILLCNQSFPHTV